MEKNRIQKKLDELFENPKSKNFLNHLIRAYLPIGKAVKVWDKPEKKFRCVLTNAPLISIGEALDGMQTEEFKADFHTHLKAWVNGNQEVQSPMVKMLNGKVLGFTGDDTTTYMSQEAYQEFYNWVVSKMLSGDKHINWLINSMQKDQFVKRAESVASDDVQKKALKAIKKSIKNHKRATTTLGDLGVLQELKAKLESNGE